MVSVIPAASKQKYSTEILQWKFKSNNVFQDVDDDVDVVFVFDDGVNVCLKIGFKMMETILKFPLSFY